MKILQLAVALRTSLFVPLSLVAFPVLSQDLAGSADHPLLSRFPGSSIIAYEQRAHDQTFIPSQPDLGSGDWVAGRLTWIAYRAPADSSVLQLYRNYEKALSGAGFDCVCLSQRRLRIQVLQKHA